MSLADVQTLLLHPPHAAAVQHLVLRVSPGRSGEALRLLQRLVSPPPPARSPSDTDAGEEPHFPLTCGPDAPAHGQVQCSLGFTWRGLQALAMPPAYLRVFARLAPAFAQGAALRGAQLGDSGASAPARWEDGFRLDAAHVLLTLHGPGEQLDKAVEAIPEQWAKSAKLSQSPRALVRVGHCSGARLGAPDGQQGQWVHFGYRDGLSDHRIEGVPSAPADARAPHRITIHRAGEFLLGHVNDSGFNVFGLPRAPEAVRSFFRDGGFGVLRPLLQDVPAFEETVERWRTQAHAELGTKISTDWVKAKLCGRWPSGESLRPGQFERQPGDFEVDFKDDGAGTGCPWSAHVRRMRSSGPEGDAHQRSRPLLRRGMPFGTALWHDTSSEQQRGLAGLFFCASLEDQFEHLLGQWANRRRLGAPDAGSAKDPLIGQHENAQAPMLIPRADGQPPLSWTGFSAWTRTLGTLYAWHPSRTAVQRILDQDYRKPDEGGPWL